MSTKDIVAIAVFAALIAALGFIPAVPLPFFPIPLTTQLLGVMLAGAALGPIRGFLTICIVWIFVAAGLPILSGGRGGIAIFYGPTAGYLVGWGFGAFTIGALYHLFRNNLTPIREIIAIGIGGVIVVHALGILWLSYTSNLNLKHTLLADTIFIIPDAIKITITYYVMKMLRKALPDMFDNRIF